MFWSDKESASRIVESQQTYFDKARVDDVFYTINGNTRLCNVGWEDDFPGIARRGIKNKWLFLRWKSGIKRQSEKFRRGFG